MNPALSGAIPKPIFSTVKSLTWYIFERQKSHGEKPKIRLKIVNQKVIFHKTPL